MTRPPFVLAVVCPLLLACGGNSGGTANNNNNTDAGFIPCGDGIIDPGEECDDGTGNSDDDPDACRTDCNRAHCGDGVKDSDEACDGSQLDNQTCTDHGFDGGTLACSSTCEFDVSGCAECGNDLREEDEECDGTEFGGLDCQALTGLQDGILIRTPGCSIETSNCHSCGNDSIEGPELCDGAALGGATCQTQGFTGGILACTVSCGYDTSACYSCGNGVCEVGEDLASDCANSGDSVINLNEDCDGAARGGQSCAGLGFTGGTLSCGASCNFHTSACLVLGVRYLGRVRRRISHRPGVEPCQRG